MAELLTHALVAYILATVLSARYRWITPSYVTIAMVGALVPDLYRVSLLVANEHLEALLGVPFDWFAIHTVGGCFLAVTIGALCTVREHRRRVFALLALGALSHLFLDGLLQKPSGHAEMLLWPLTEYHPPTPGLYLSSDRWPAIVAGSFAIAVWIVRYRLLGNGSSSAL